MAISLTTPEIRAARPARGALDPWRPYLFFVEDERTAAGEVEPVATLFLTNRECPFTCLMCDLWKHTLAETVPRGAIPAQIDFALSQLPAARHVKLYNSGNFFDPHAIPPDDFPDIARRLSGFETVIVENHPRLCGDVCLRFRDLLQGPRLEVAMGLETIHPEVLPRLNKQMTLEDYSKASRFLRDHGIDLRAFVLLRPPFLDEAEGVEWAVRSLQFAFDHGVGCCTVIPTRGGNGILDRLRETGEFAPPRLSSLEVVLERGLALDRGRVFVDLWEVERLFECPRCGPARAERLRFMNFSQQPAPPISCDCIA